MSVDDEELLNPNEPQDSAFLRNGTAAHHGGEERLGWSLVRADSIEEREDLVKDIHPDRYDQEKEREECMTESRWIADRGLNYINTPPLLLSSLFLSPCTAAVVLRSTTSCAMCEDGRVSRNELEEFLWKLEITEFSPKMR
jgi:hypothetical protein